MFREVTVLGVCVGWIKIKPVGLGKKDFEINDLVLDKKYSPRTGGFRLEWGQQNPDEPVAPVEPTVPGFYKIESGFSSAFVVFQLRPNDVWYIWDSRELSGVYRTTWDHITTYLDGGKELVKI